MMIATISFLVVSATIIFGLVGPIVRQQKVVSNLLASRQSYFLAEAGVEDVSYRIMAGAPVGTFESLTLGGETVAILTTAHDEHRTVTATGNVNNMARKIEANLRIGEGVTFHYGIQVGAGGFVLGNNSGVNGNVYSNASILGSNGSFISGSVSAVDTVSNITIGTTGTGDAHATNVVNSTIKDNLYCETGSGNNKPCDTSKEPPPFIDFPIDPALLALWQQEAAAGGTVGSQAITGPSNSLGPKKIVGDLTLAIGAKLTITGSLWVTGNVLLNNNAQLTLSPAYGTSDGIILVDGLTSFVNGSTFSGSGLENSFIMLVSTNTTASAVDIANNSAGAMIVYVPYGTVHLNNNAAVEQVTAKTISIAPNSVIDYDSGLIDTSFTSGPGGGFEVDSWKEVQ